MFFTHTVSLVPELLIKLVSSRKVPLGLPPAERCGKSTGSRETLLSWDKLCPAVLGPSSVLHRPHSPPRSDVQQPSRLTMVLGKRTRSSLASSSSSTTTESSQSTTKSDLSTLYSSVPSPAPSLKRARTRFANSVPPIEEFNNKENVAPLNWFVCGRSATPDVDASRTTGEGDDTDEETPESPVRPGSRLVPSESRTTGEFRWHVASDTEWKLTPDPDRVQVIPVRASQEHVLLPPQSRRPCSTRLPLHQGS